MLSPRSLTLTPLLASLIAAAALVACNRAEEPRAAGQVLDQTETQVEQMAHGTAPGAAARELAAQLAKAVTSVTRTNNELSVTTDS